jgi:hypothetical protein
MRFIVPDLTLIDRLVRRAERGRAVAAPVRPGPSRYTASRPPTIRRRETGRSRSATMSWWERNITEPGKLPLLLCAVGFLVTFTVTRAIVRSIRAGRGPFRNVSAGSTHVHHVVPGTILMVTGGLLGLATLSEAANAGAGLVFGIGLALVLDEFALILHLDDVYWEAEGRLSVDAVFVVGALLLLLLLGVTPAGVDDLPDVAETARWVIAANLLVVFTCAVVGCLKGKVTLSLLGLFLPFVGIVTALRLAHPRSPWARWHYPPGSVRRERAERRSARFDRRWGRMGRRIQDAVAGAPSQEPPGPGLAAGGTNTGPQPTTPGASEPAHARTGAVVTGAPSDRPR